MRRLTLPRGLCHCQPIYARQLQVDQQQNSIGAAITHWQLYRRMRVSWRSAQVSGER
jgi:hypothetical protein